MPVGVTPVGRMAAMRQRCDGRRAAAHAAVRPARCRCSCAASLGGCASMSDKMSQAMSSMPVVGLPADAPERPAEALRVSGGP